jgi:multiple sugar transport system substrate-binding protein
VTGLFAGCRAPKPGPPSRPAPRWPGVTVRIQCPAAGPVRRLLETHGRTWAHENEAKLILVDQGEADLEVMPPQELPGVAVRSRLAPLRDASVTAALLPLYRVRLLSWADTTYALPLVGDGLVCVFRADLYADAPTQTAFKRKYKVDLAPPVTWDDFAAQAAFFAEVRGKPSLPPLPSDDPGLERAFGVVAAPLSVFAVTGSLRPRTGDDPNRLAAYSFQYDAQTGEPRIASPGFVEALRLLQQLEPHRSAKPTAVAALRDDEAVIAIVTLDELGALREGGRGRWGVVRVPGSGRVYAHGALSPGSVNVVPYVGSTGALGAVRAGSAVADAASDLLHYLSSESVSQEVVHDPSIGGGPFRDAHLSKQSAGWFAYGLDDANTARLREALREMADPRLDNPALALRIPDQASHRAVLAAAIRKAVAEKSDPAPVLAEVDRQWRRLDGNPATARELYRKSLGL